MRMSSRIVFVLKKYINPQSVAIITLRFHHPSLNQRHLTGWPYLFPEHLFFYGWTGFESIVLSEISFLENSCIPRWSSK